MKMFETPADLAACAGKELGVSEWMTIDQPMIDAFADLTGDRQWIHVDVDRTRDAMPGGRTIAHGMLILSVLPAMRVYGVRRFSRALNYGFDRIRFVAPVPSGARIRHRLTLVEARPVSGGYRFVQRSLVELDGAGDAIAADQVILFQDPAQPGDA